IGLAILGAISQLFTNTAAFLGNILMMLGFGAAIFVVIYFVFLRKRTPSTDSKKYKQAVKQSKAKYNNNNISKPAVKSTKRSNPQQMKKKSNRLASHLRVIDGNKSKRKNRASL